jgi:hypothetical protein
VTPRRGPETRAVRALHGLAPAVLALVIVSAFSRPLFYWDSWAYHLPFSALLWDIGDASRVFVLGEEMRRRYEGFPLLAELLQGALWKLTGSIKATALINAVALVAFVLAAGKSLRLSVPLLTFSTLAVPLVALHATSNYIDLFVGVCVCFQALAAVKLLGAAEIDAACRGPTPVLPGSVLQGSVPGLIQRKAPFVERTKARAPHAWWLAAYVAAAAAAGNSKFNGLILSFAISAFVLAYLFIDRRALGGPRVKVAACAVALACVLAAATSERNAWRFGNPVYPVDTTVVGVHLRGPEPEYRNYPDYTAPLGVLARPANWLLSISEIDWIVRGVDHDYSLDLATGDKPARYGPARTGGDWGALVIASVLLALALAVIAGRRNAVVLRSRRTLLALFAWLSVATAFSPQSHELRYSLHWPLLLMVVVAALASAAKLSSRARAALVAAYLGAFLVSESMLDFPLRPWPALSQDDVVGSQTSTPEIAAARTAGGLCLGADYNPRQFAYSAVFHGGNYVIEQGWKPCAIYPQYGDRK